MTAVEAMEIIHSKIPPTLQENLKFRLTRMTNRCLLQKFSLAKVKLKSFISNSLKVFNYFAQHDIKYHLLTFKIFKKRLKITFYSPKFLRGGR